MVSQLLLINMIMSYFLFTFSFYHDCNILANGLVFCGVQLVAHEAHCMINNHRDNGLVHIYQRLWQSG